MTLVAISRQSLPPLPGNPTVEPPSPLATAREHWARFYAWWLHVETDDLVRQSLNKGVARLSLFMSLLGLMAALPIAVFDRPIFGFVSISVVPCSLLAWALGRRGSVAGAQLHALVMLVLVLLCVSPVAEAFRTDSGINLLYALPVMFSAVFVRPGAAWWYFGAEVAVVSVRLLFAGHPLAIRYIVLLVVDLGFVTILVIFAAGMLYSLLGKMEEEVAQRTADLSDALKKQERLNASRVRLLQDVAHDFGNLTTAIFGNLGLLQETLADIKAGRPVAPQDEPSLLLLHIFDTVQNASRYGKQLRDAALIEQGEFPLRLDALDLVQLAHQVADPLIDGFRYKDIALVVAEPTEQIPLVWADSALCQRVIENFLVNALRYALTDAPNQRVTVTITASTSPAGVRLAVQDTGRGVSPERLVELGQRFCQLHRGEIVEGKGMGLSFCARALQVMGGKLIFTSSGENQGATAAMILPLAPSSPEEAHPPFLPLIR